MGMNNWVMLVTALGGIEGIKQLIKWWMSRKTNARIEDAHADVEEFKEYYLRSILQNATPGKDELKDAIDMTKFRIVFLYDGFMPSTYNMHTDRPETGTGA